MRAKIVSLLFLIFSAFLFAETLIVGAKQHFEWNNISYADSYIFVLEIKTQKDDFKLFKKIETNKNEVQIDVPAGFYRYKVQVINFFGEFVDESEWHDFDVTYAIKPKIAGFPLLINAYYNTDFLLLGNNFSQNSHVDLQLNKSDTKIQLKTAFVNSTKINVFLDQQDIQNGMYTISVLNPGDVWAKNKLVSIYTKKYVHMNVLGGYAPYIFLGKNSFSNQLLQTAVLPLGFTLEGEYVPFKFTWGTIGAGLMFSGARGASKRVSTVSASFFSMLAQGVYKYTFFPFPITVSAKIGAGATILAGLKLETPNHGVLEKPLVGIVPAIGLGLQAQYDFAVGAYGAIGVDYLQMFFADVDGSVLIPRISFGWRF